MKPISYVFLFLSLIFFANSCQKAIQKTTSDHSKEIFLKDLDMLQNQLKNDFLPLATHSNNVDSLQKVFIECRNTYKKIEHITEYFMPSASILVNGPPLNEIELEENKVFAPSGFQVIEPFIFQNIDSENRKELVMEIKKLIQELKKYKQLEEIAFSENQIFDAIRLQIFRINTLGISGFDTPLCQTFIIESNTSLKSMRRYIEPSIQANESKSKEIIEIWNKCESYLSTQKKTENFDYLEFVKNYSNNLSRILVEFQEKLAIPVLTETRPLRVTAKTLFDKDIFDANFYAPNADSYVTKERVALGKKLFYDQTLTSSNRSCGSCHQAEKAFTDGKTKALSISGSQIQRNTPTLTYAALQNAQFYDLRVNNLEAQAFDVVLNKDEMHGSFDEAIKIIMKDEAYLKAFKFAYPNLKQINQLEIQNALASFTRSLIPFNSKFDKFMRNEITQLTEQEKKGFNLFMGKGKCGICHFMPVFNGTAPPSFTHTDSEVIGVFESTKSKKLDKDLGRGKLNPFEDWLYAFKTPTLRNIGKTAPYMHNGAYKTLEEVIDFYNNGGAVGMGVDLPNQTLASDKLNLTETEKKSLISFLQTLSDE